MPTSRLRRPSLRLALIAGGLTLALSGCHLHHGYVGGGFGYHGGHHGGGHYRGHGYHKKRDHGGHRRHGRGGWRGRY